MAENKVLDEENYYKEFMRNVPVPICVIDEKGKGLMVNDTFKKFYKMKKGDVRGFKVENLYEKNDISVIRKVFDECKSKENASCKATAITGDDVHIPVILNFKMMKISGKKYVVASSADITEVDELRGYMKNIFYSMPVPTTLLDLEGKRIDTSVSKASLFKRSREEIIGLKADEMYSKNDVDKIKDCVKNAKDGKECTVEATGTRGDGTTFDSIMSFAPLKNKHGKITNILLSLTDITKQKNREDELQKSTEDTMCMMEYIGSGDYSRRVSTDYELPDVKLFAETINTVMDHLKRSDEELQDLIKELATPAIEVMEKVVVMPLVGRLSSDRALDAMEAILNKLEEIKGKVGIVDITGVAGIDTAVADNIIKTMESIKLVGAVPVLTGISAKTAGNLVRIGVKFDFATVSTLAEGLDYAIKILNN